MRWRSVQHRRKKRKVTKTRVMRFMSDALAEAATVFGLMAFNWAFWIDGDDGPDEVFTAMITFAFALAALSFLIDYHRHKILRERRLTRLQQRFAEIVDFCNEAEKLDMEHEASYEHETEPARIGGMVSAPEILRLLGMNDSVDALHLMIEVNKKRAENKAKAERDPQPAPELHTYDVNIGSMTIKKGTDDEEDEA